MFSIIPKYTPVNTADDPPLLISGNGCPVTGPTPVATIIFSNAWNTSPNASPIIKNAGNA